MGEDHERNWVLAGIISEASYALTIAISKGEDEISRFRLVLDPIIDSDPESWVGGDVPPNSIAELLERARQLSDSTVTPCTWER